MNKGVIAISSGFLGRYREFDKALANTVKPEGTNIAWQFGVNIARQWNNCVKVMLSGHYEWLWILGDDHIWPPDLLQKLYDRNVDVVVPVCCVREAPFFPIFHKPDGGRVQGIDAWNLLKGRSGLVELENYITGNAGMLIRRHVFETIPSPWFTVGQLIPDLGSSDLYFAQQLRKHGIKSYIDLDNAIGHIFHGVVFPRRGGDGAWDYLLKAPGDDRLNDVRHGEGIDWTVSFNDWRARYDQLNYAAHRQFYETLARNFPSQRQYNASEFKKFVAEFRPLRVFELGGWRGELAQEALSSSEILEWFNVEICGLDHVCKDERYRAVVYDRFVWDLRGNFTDFDCLVLSHSLEHIKRDNFDKLLKKLPFLESVYIDAPIPETTDAVNWENYMGTHILEIGWDDVDEMLMRRGFTNTYKNGSVRFYKRIR